LLIYSYCCFRFFFFLYLLFCRHVGYFNLHDIFFSRRPYFNPPPPPSVGKTPWSAELGFELGSAVQQASTLPTELCCNLHCYGGLKYFRNFPVIYYMYMKKVKCVHRVGSNLQSLALLDANYPLSHCCIAY